MTTIDRLSLEETLLTLTRTPTSVPAGQTAIEPGDPGILSAIETVLLPMLEALEPQEIRRHPDGEVAVRFGPDSDDGVLVQTYLVSQHGDPAKLADDTFIDESLVDGRLRRTVVGPGTLQNKGAMAAAFDAVRRRPSELRRPIWLTLNAEGRSSHGGSRRILDDLGVRAAQGIVMISTGSRVSLGNRGRVDLLVAANGLSSHSSQPWLGENALDHAGDVITALRAAPLPHRHPLLGPAAHTPYAIRASPIAPHTTPSRVEVTVDRRLLPGEIPSAAAESLREFLAGDLPFPVEVIEAAWMLPALVDRDEPVVRAFEHTLGEDRTMYSPNTYDAGYACSLGIPTVMFGPGVRDFGGGLTRAESVSIEECEEASDAMLAVLSQLCA